MHVLLLEYSLNLVPYARHGFPEAIFLRGSEDVKRNFRNLDGPMSRNPFIMDRI